MATNKPTCSVPKCSNQVISRRLCNKHYIQFRNSADFEPKRRLTSDERFFAKVNKTETCWNWTGATSNRGYSKFYLGGQYLGGHRVSYEMHVGPIPDGMQVDHTCHNVKCVNPLHLRLATGKQNAEYRSGAQSNSASGIRGIRYHERGGKWEAWVTHHGRQIYVGSFRTSAQAEEAAKKKRAELFTFPEFQ